MTTIAAPKPLADLLGTHVRIYRNLHKQCWSLQYREAHIRRDNGRVSYRWQVAGHAGAVLLEGVRFQVSGPVWERLHWGGAKEVHAYVSGVLLAAAPPERPLLAPVDGDYAERACRIGVTYNPRTADGPHFSRRDTGKAVFQAGRAFGNPAGKVFIDRQRDWE